MRNVAAASPAAASCRRFTANAGASVCDGPCKNYTWTVMCTESGINNTLSTKRVRWRVHRPTRGQSQKLAGAPSPTWVTSHA